MSGQTTRRNVQNHGYWRIVEKDETEKPPRFVEIDGITYKVEE